MQNLKVETDRKMSNVKYFIKHINYCEKQLKNLTHNDKM